MHRFPAEFSALLNANGKRLAGGLPAGRRKPERGPQFMLYDGVMERATAQACSRLLDRHIYSHLRSLVDPIPRDSITGMKENYGEMLPKTVCLKTCFLFSRRFEAFAPADDIGLVTMLRSESLHRFAESATGLRLERPAPQVICYSTGDYSGPHNDHHPENERVKDGYVDLHIMFGNDAVAHQWLVYEQNRHFQAIRDINLQGGIAVYRLPFWHYTTPLAAKPGREKAARRWLLLVSFEILRRERNPPRG